AAGGAGAAAAAGGAERRHEAAASSHAEVAVAPDGTLTLHARNARLEPYALFDGERYLPRLATVTTDVRQRTDAEGYDPSSTVSVTVDDLSGPTPVRLAAFSDPGAAGVRLTEEYFDSLMTGCCGGPTLHSVRALETGRLLFRATGDGDGGSSAWAEVPNARPPILRWAAFDGAVDEEALARGVVGVIAYGSREATLSRLELRAATAEAATDLNLGLSHEARLVWIDEVSGEPGDQPASGSPAAAEPIWSLEGVAAPDGMTGFALRLLDYDGKPLVTIPVRGDRLAGEDAMAAEGLSLAATEP
ncbi:MAG: hypothetical protein IRY94_16225, partial [Rhodospirillaceae bacterium]|nr:hypothetical protein [Rhodospirillaceae bacterium]